MILIFMSAIVLCSYSTRRHNNETQLMSLKPLPIRRTGTQVMGFKKPPRGDCKQIIFKRMFLIYFQFFYLLSNTSKTARQAKLSVCNGFLAFLISLGVIVEFMRNFKAITIIFYGILIHWSTACETSPGRVASSRDSFRIVP